MKKVEVHYLYHKMMKRGIEYSYEVICDKFYLKLRLVNYIMLIADNCNTHKAE